MKKYGYHGINNKEEEATRHFSEENNNNIIIHSFCGLCSIITINHGDVDEVTGRKGKVNV